MFYTVCRTAACSMVLLHVGQAVHIECMCVSGPKSHSPMLEGEPRHES